MSYRDDCHRVYKVKGRYAHLLSPDTTPSSDWSKALCGMDGQRSDWLGTGTQAEYERAARLPLCPRCSQLATGRNAA